MSWSRTELGGLAAALRQARRVVVLTGAGASAESGVPTFRGAGGLWKGYDPMQLATPEAFARDPHEVWEWYDWRRQKVAACRPNPGHEALAELERRIPEFLLVTQNVDRLHQDAGSEKVVELHGDIWTLRCSARCGHEAEDRRTPIPELPACPACGAPLRPGVVWFGEALPPGALDRAVAATRVCEVFLVVGTSSVVYPAASLTPLAAASGARVFEVNPEPGAGVPGVQVLRGPAGEVLPAALEAMGT